MFVLRVTLLPRSCRSARLLFLLRCSLLLSIFIRFSHSPSLPALCCPALPPFLNVGQRCRSADSVQQLYACDQLVKINVHWQPCCGQTLPAFVVDQPRKRLANHRASSLIELNSLSVAHSRSFGAPTNALKITYIDSTACQTLLRDLPCTKCTLRIPSYFGYHVFECSYPHPSVTCVTGCWNTPPCLSTSWHPLADTGCLLPPCAHHHVPHHQLMPNISSHPGASANSHSPAVSQQA